jgi:molybdopterin converting factor small subunit
MAKQTRIFLYGSLRPDIAQESMMEYLQEGPLPLPELLKRLPVQAERVQLVMVNHKAVSFDYVVCPDDRVALFPREYIPTTTYK